MVNISNAEIEEKFNGAIADKSDGRFRASILNSLKDHAIQDEWAQIKTLKSAITDAQSYDIFVTRLLAFFHSICERITAPGVDAFMNWLTTFGSFNRQSCLSLREHLINNYQYPHYADKVELIIENENVIKIDIAAPKLFDNIFKLIHKDIQQDINELLKSPDLLNTTTIPFLEAQAQRLELLATLPELTYSSPIQLFPEDRTQEEVAFYLDVAEDAIKYINDAKPGKYSDQHDRISDEIEERLEDLQYLISELFTLGIHSENNETRKLLFEKTKASIVGKQGTLKQQWSEYLTNIWDPIDESYSEITNYFARIDDINLETLHNGKGKWQLPDLNTELVFVISKLEEESKSNPIDKLEKLSSKDTLNNLIAKHASIKELRSNLETLKAKLFQSINDKVEEFRTSKKTVIDSLLAKTPAIRQKSNEINEKLKALTLIKSDDYENKDFLVFLSNDFDGFYEIYESLDTIYTEILKETGLKENIEWLNAKLNGGDEVDLNTGDFSKHEMLTKLMEVNLIRLTIAKNI